MTEFTELHEMAKTITQIELLMTYCKSPNEQYYNLQSKRDETKAALETMLEWSDSKAEHMIKGI